MSGDADDDSDNSDDPSRGNEVGEARYTAQSAESHNSEVLNSSNKDDTAQSGVSTITTRNEAADISPTEAEVEIHHGDDFNEPITWPWSYLLELYTFVDKYVTSDFRTTVFTIIQQKPLQSIPRMYRLPNQVDVKFAVDRLPHSSPLFRLLGDIYAVGASPKNFGDTPLQQAAALESLLSDFLAGCFIAASRRQATLTCRKCAFGEGDDCDDASHNGAEVFEVRDRDPCFYHDHGENQAEAERCAAHWRTWLREARGTTSVFIRSVESEHQHGDAQQ